MKSFSVWAATDITVMKLNKSMDEYINNLLMTWFCV